MNQDFTYGRNFANYLGSFWSSIFDNGALGEAIGYASSDNLIQLYMDMVDIINSSSIYTVPVFSRSNVYPVTIKKSEFVNYSEYPEFSGGGYYGPQPDNERYKPGTFLKYGEPSKISDTYFAPSVDSSVSSLGTFAVNRLFEPSVTLCNGSDFLQVPDGIVFRDDPFKNPLFPSRQVLDTSTGEVDQEIVIWFCDVDEESYRLYKQFGYTFTNFKTSSEQYKKIIQTVFELVSNGPSSFRIDAFLSAISGSPLIREATETVESISDTPEGKIVITDLNAYQINSSLDLRPEVVVGAKLRGGTPLLDVVTMIDTRQTRWWAGMDSVPAEANTFAGIAGFIGFPNVYSEVTYVTGPDTGSGPYRGVKFPLIGKQATIDMFWENAMKNSEESGRPYGISLIEKYGTAGSGEAEYLEGTPFSVNPAQVFAEDMASGAIMAIKVKLAEVSDLDRFFKTINVLSASCPVHLRLMLFLEFADNLDLKDISSAQSSVDLADLPLLVAGDIGASSSDWSDYGSAEAVSADGASYPAAQINGVLDVSSPDFPASDLAGNSTSYLSVASNTSLTPNGGSFSVCGWFKIKPNHPIPPYGPRIGIIAKYNDWVMYYDPSSGPSAKMRVFDPGNAPSSVSAVKNYPISPNNWYFMCGVWDNSTHTAKISINGSTFSMDSSGGFGQSGSSNNIVFGYENGTNAYLSGYLGPIGYWKGRALSEADAIALYNGGKGYVYSNLPSALASGLTSWWNMNEASGSRFDSVGSNHLTNHNVGTTGTVTGPDGQVLEKIDLSSASVIVQNIELKQIPKCIV